MKKAKLHDGKVVLLRFFWGHPPGTKGRIRQGKLRLAGSPTATVTINDLESLFVYALKQ